MTPGAIWWRCKKFFWKRYPEGIQQNKHHSSIISRLLQSHHKPRGIVSNRVNIKAPIFVFIYLNVHSLLCNILIRVSTKTNGIVILNYRMIFSETLIYRYRSNTQYLYLCISIVIKIDINGFSLFLFSFIPYILSISAKSV